jgi:hypothetical protein
VELGGRGGQLSRDDEVTTSSDSPLRAQNRWRAFSLEPEVKKLIQADRRAVGMLEPTSWRFQGNAKDEARPGRTRRTATPYNENGLNAGVGEFFQFQYQNIRLEKLVGNPEGQSPKCLG